VSPSREWYVSISGRSLLAVLLHLFVRLTTQSIGNVTIVSYKTVICVVCSQVVPALLQKVFGNPTVKDSLPLPLKTNIFIDRVVFNKGKVNGSGGL